MANKKKLTKNRKARLEEKAKKENFEAVAGVEIAVKHKKTEFHLVALFIEERYFDKIKGIIRISR